MLDYSIQSPHFDYQWGNQGYLGRKSFHLEESKEGPNNKVSVYGWQTYLQIKHSYDPDDDTQSPIDFYVELKMAKEDYLLH